MSKKEEMVKKANKILETITGVEEREKITAKNVDAGKWVAEREVEDKRMIDKIIKDEEEFFEHLKKIGINI